VSLILIIAVAGMAVAGVVALSLGTALRRSKSQDDDEARLARLGAMRGPSGQPFFADRKSALELSEEIHDVERGA
jgi:prepilin signal peptidase PulO-like enzyme (type II secretory pathway)